MKRVLQTRISLADAQPGSPKRPKDASSADKESSSLPLESGFHAAALTRSESENLYGSPSADTETNRPSFEPGSRHHVREDDAEPTSSFQRAVTDLEAQKTEKRNELLELDCKEQDLYKAEMTRLRIEVKRQCVELEQLTKHSKSVTSERDKLLVDKNGLQSELTQEVNKVQRLTAQITEKVAENGILLNEKKKLEGDLVLERSKLNKLGTSLAQQRKQVVELTTECHGHLIVIAQRDQQAMQKDEEFSNLKADRDTFKNECERLKKEKDDEIDRLNGMLRTMRVDLETANNINSRELAKRDELKNQADAALSDLRSEYTSHLDDCKSKLERLNEDLATCKDALERKRQATHLIDAGYALHRKNNPKAYELFDRASVLDDDAMLPRYRKACHYFQQDDYEGCVQTCTMACERVTASIKRAAVSQASVPRDVSPEQMSHLEEGVQFYGRSLAHYWHVDVVEKHRRYADLQQRLYIDRELSQKALERGNQFVELEKFEEALEEYNEAVKRNPGNARLYPTRAYCHLQCKPKNCADAINDCKTALKLDPYYADAYTKMGAAHQALGHHPQAEEAYKKAVALDPAQREAKQSLKDLQRYPVRRCTTRT